MIVPSYSMGVVPTGATLDSRTPQGLFIDWVAAVGPFPSVVGTPYTSGAPLVDFDNYATHSRGDAISFTGTPAPPTGLTLNTNGTVTGTPTTPSQSVAMTVTATAGAVSSPKAVTVTTQAAAASGFVGEPGITMTAGTISDEAMITLAGSGFGTMEGDVVQYLRGNERANSAAIHGTTPTVGPTVTTFVIGLSTDPGAEHLYFSNARVRPGRTLSLRRRHSSRTTGTYHAGGFGFAGITPRRKVYFSYWRYFSYDGLDPKPEGPNVNLKQWYMYGDGDPASATGTGNPPSAFLIPANTGNAWRFYHNNSTRGGDTATLVVNRATTTGVWQLWESVCVLNSSPALSDGRAAGWVDNVLQVDDTSFSWYNGSWPKVPTGWRDFRLGYMDQEYADETLTDYTDYYFADTEARIMLGDAPTYAACSHKEQQLIRNADWSDTQLKFKLNKGSFASYAGTYLYRLNNSGVAMKLGSLS
jgi:hypothetical protein